MNEPRPDAPFSWPTSPFGFYAETGTEGGDAEGCNALFFDHQRACEYVRKHGGYVVSLYRGPPPLGDPS
jgi:hypothetical protein